ncbi:D-hexose-6-phosphate mutarotase [Orbaceae bacterium ESL0727]|nr:D-hexose-6-phosphate mutarotase [Orbaceae bacterium ESL0727]
MSIIQTLLETKKTGKPLSASVSQSTFGELPILVITHNTCHAAVSLQGAQLLFWQPTRQATPVIWLSDKAIFKKGTPVRGGVPVCWPWFGKVNDPMHGFARIVEWQLTSVQEDDNGVDLTLSLTNTAQTSHYFSKPFSLSLAIHVGKTCQISLSCLGDFEATSALHTYFAVDNIENVIVSGLSDDYLEKTATENRPKVAGQLTIDREVDRVYADAEDIITINDKKRIIKITNYNANDVVTWNSWIDKVKTIADLDNDSYKIMLCVETGRINRPLRLSPTEKTTYGFKIDVL